MRATVPTVLHNGRLRCRDVLWDSTADDGLLGAFQIVGPMGRDLRILSSGPTPDTGWEHVSVSVQNRPPNWAEMCRVKDLFWDDEEMVMQIHPPRSEYVNHHPFCLHLWKPVGVVLPLPPSHLVGPK